MKEKSSEMLGLSRAIKTETSHIFSFKKAIVGIASILAVCASTVLHAGQAFFDFKTDPSSFLNINSNVGANWSPTGGVDGANDGYLIITEAQGSQKTVIVFDDFDNGLVVKGFEFSCYLKVGEGSSPPADGFSINYARADDPVVLDPMGGQFATGPNNEANLPEEGTQTGLAIGFDMWQSGTADPTQTGDVRYDCIGLSVRIDNRLVKQVWMPNATPLLTGPAGALTWQPFSVTLTTDGYLTVKYQGITYIDRMLVDFAPGPGRLVFAGRTGGAYCKMYVDNISIKTYPAPGPVLGQIRGNPAGFDFEINDQGPVILDPQTVQIKVNAQPVNYSKYEKVDITSKFSVNIFPQTFPARSTNVIEVSYKDNRGTNIVESRSFIVPDYTMVPATAAVPENLVNKNISGFTAYVTQATTNNGTLPNSTARAEQQIRGLLINPATGQPYQNIINGGPTFTVNYINWNQDAGLGTDIGNFRDISDPPRPDDAIPGVPGTIEPDNTDNIAAEIIGYLKLDPGTYQFGVNSDDGFRVTVGAQPRDMLNTQLGIFEGGRGSSDTLFWLVVTNGGYYPVRLIWYEGNGGANVEFFSIVGTNKVLINDLAIDGAIVSYASANIPGEAIVDYVTPIPDSTGVNPGTSITAILLDQGSSTVDLNSVTMTVAGNPVTVQKTKSGTRTTVTFVPTQFLDQGVTIPVTISYTAGGKAYTKSWSFRTASGVPVIPAIYAQPLGSGLEPGMTVRLVYTTASANNTAYTEDALAGRNWTIIGYGFEKTDYIYYNIAAPASFGSFGSIESRPVPGQLLFGTVNMAMEAVAYLELKRGAYRMGVNSDDGFRVTCGATPQDVSTVLGEYSGGRGFSDTMFNFLVPVDGIYPFRLTWEQGGGGAGVQWFIEDLATGTRTLINYPGSPIKAYRYCSTLNQNVQITQQPVSTNIVQNRKATFSVQAVCGSITNPAVFAYQWQVKAPNATTFTDIEGANGPTYTMADPAGAWDNGNQYRCIVTLLGYQPVTSSTATLTVTADTEPPQVYSVSGDAALSHIKISFNELIDQQSVWGATYTVSGLQVLGAELDATGTNVILTTSKQVPGTKYTITISGIYDLSMNQMAQTQKTFTAWVFDTGFVIREFYGGIGGTAVTDLTGSDKYTKGMPDWIDALFSTESGPDFADNYGIRVLGFIIPPVTGDYYFLIAGDDSTALYLSTDDNPANLSTDPIAYFNGWTGFRQWNAPSSQGSGQQKSNPINLQAGKKYYFEAFQKEGGGGDSLSVAWVRPDAPNATNVIGSQYIGAFANPDVASITVVQQPQNTTVLQNRRATFSIVATGTSSFGTNVSYQWQKNGVDIAGATGPTYTTPLAQLSDNGAQFRCVLRVPGLQTNSAAAVLTVQADTVAPVAVSAGALVGRSEVGIMFDELLDPVSAGTAANYSVAGATVTKAQLRPSGQQVVLTLDKAVAAGASVSYSGVKDLAGNAGSGSVAIAIANLYAQDVGTTNAAGQFTDPVFAGSAYAYSSDSFEVVAGGSDIWNNTDGFHFVYQQVTGDFDVKVRVESLQYVSDNWAKAGLMMREDLSGGSRNLNIVVDPTQGANIWECNYRGTPNGSSAGWPGEIQPRPGPVTYPNAWVRLTRVGELVTAYRSTNGVDWEVRATMDLTGANVPSTLFVGLCTTAHNNSGTNTIAQYREFSLVSGGVPPAAPKLAIAQIGDGMVKVTWPASAEGFVLQAADQVTGPYADITTGIEVVGNDKQYVVPAAQSPKFFRLKK
jgi:hypothetical protein